MRGAAPGRLPLRAKRAEPADHRRIRRGPTLATACRAPALAEGGGCLETPVQLTTDSDGPSSALRYTGCHVQQEELNAPYWQDRNADIRRPVGFAGGDPTDVILVKDRHLQLIGHLLVRCRRQLNRVFEFKPSK